MPEDRKEAALYADAAKHLDAHLGAAASVLRFDHPLTIEMRAYTDKPGRGVITLCSVGLSQLQQAHNGLPLGQEILLGVTSDQFSEGLLKAFASFVSNVVDSQHRSPLRQGEVISVKQPLVAGAPHRDLLVELPVYYPEELWQSPGPSPITFVWLVPLLPSEAQLVSERGYNELADRFEQRDPYLFDLERASVA